MPLRDDRLGRRATIGSGKAPLRPDFHSAGSSTTDKPSGIASDSPTPSPQADNSRNSDPNSDSGPFQREGVHSSVTIEAPRDVRELERNGSLHTIASKEAHADGHSVNTHANAPSKKTYATALTEEAHTDASLVKANADARSAKMDATAPTVEAHAGASPAKANADARSVKAHATAPALEAHADASSLKANADAPWIETHAGVPLVAMDAHASSMAIQPRSLLEPADVLMAMVRPFLRLRSAIMRLANLPIIGSGSASSYEPADERTRAAGTVERSFANEVASLLQAPVIEAVSSPQPVREAPLPLAPTATSPGQPESAGPATAEQCAMFDASSAGSPSEGPAPDREVGGAASVISPVDTQATANARPQGRFERDEPTEKPAFRNGVREPRNGVIDDNSAVRIDVWKGNLSDKQVGVGTGEPSEQNIVVARVLSRYERAVPITRLPLRPQGLDITWMTELPDQRPGPLSRTARHELLEHLIRNPGTVSSDAIVRAYHQEEGEGRALALRVLLRNFPQAGRAAFVQALRVGSDEERALAIDGLTALGAREEMTPAFSDRVDAIAAKAALSYVGTLERADFRAELSPFIDETRIEAILNLLAGIVE